MPVSKRATRFLGVAVGFLVALGVAAVTRRTLGLFWPGAVRGRSSAGRGARCRLRAPPGADAGPYPARRVIPCPCALAVHAQHAPEAFAASSLDGTSSGGVRADHRSLR